MSREASAPCRRWGVMSGRVARSGDRESSCAPSLPSIQSFDFYSMRVKKFRPLSASGAGVRGARHMDTKHAMNEPPHQQTGTLRGCGSRGGGFPLGGSRGFDLQRDAPAVLDPLAHRQADLLFELLHELVILPLRGDFARSFVERVEGGSNSRVACCFLRVSR